MIALNLHFSVFFTPEQPAGRAYPRGNEDSVLLIGWVLLGDVFGLVNQIIIKLTGDADFVGIDLDLPEFFQ
jgi:hypothetical protein